MEVSIPTTDDAIEIHALTPDGTWLPAMSVDIGGLRAFGRYQEPLQLKIVPGGEMDRRLNDAIVEAVRQNIRENGVLRAEILKVCDSAGIGISSWAA
jgi:hypothetical protein